MTALNNENEKWIPFGILTIILLISTGFWKIEKNREIPLVPFDQASAQQQQGAAPPPSPMEGKQAPDFAIPALGGGILRLADYRGKVVFLNVWATWCPPCREEMPSMQKLHEHFKDRNFAMITISIDADTTPVGPFMEELGLTFPVGFDPKKEVVDQYHTTGVPETFLIAPDGTVLHHVVGPSDWYSDVVIGIFETLIGRSEDDISG